MKKVCIIDCGSNKTKQIIKIVEDAGFSTEIWYLYYPNIAFKLDISTKNDKVFLFKKTYNHIIKATFNEDFTQQYKSIIFSGGGLLKEIQAEIKEYFSYLTQIETPVLGICFGHQIIGLVYKSELYQLQNKIYGNFKTLFLKQNPLIQNKDTNIDISVNKNHSEAITLAKDFILLANSKTCTNEMMMHQSKPIYGVQFHPEVSGKFGKDLICNFLLI